MKKPLPKRYWIEDSIRVVALECESKSDLRLKFPGAYSAGRKLGILDSLEFKPKSPNIDRANEAVHLIYVYLDNENNVAYVGATLNIKKRHYQHKNSKDKVYKYFDSVNKEVPEPIILKCGLLPIDRQIEERTFSLLYREWL